MRFLSILRPIKRTGVLKVGKAHLAHERLCQVVSAYISTFEDLFGESLYHAIFIELSYCQNNNPDKTISCRCWQIGIPRGEHTCLPRKILAR